MRSKPALASGAAALLALASLAAALLAAALLAAGCGSGSGSSAPTGSVPGHPTTTARGGVTTGQTTQTMPAPAPRRKPPPPAYPTLLPGASASAPSGFVPAVSWKGKVVVRVARSPAGVALASFDQSALGLNLHSGTIDAGASGWRYGPAIAGAERRRLVAAFNGAFRLSTGAGGFFSYDRAAAPMRDGLGSIVTYADGRTDIGAWHQGVPAPGRRVVSVRQNLDLMIDHGAPAANIACASCWGATLGGVSDPARSALGITAAGHLIWAEGEHLTTAELAAALLGAHVRRAVELDINPEWVAGYFYGHRGGKGPPVPIPVAAAQHGIPGEFLLPWSRDFFTIVAR